MEEIKGFKGFNQNLKCIDKQYEVGCEFSEYINPKICETGMHFCEYPLDVFNYYAPNNSRYCDVTGSGKISKGNDKISVSKLKIVAEIGLSGIINSAIKFCFNKIKWTKENSATGDYSGASATGNCSGASATGYKSGASAGKGSVALATGMSSRAKGDIGSYIVITECEEIKNEFYIKDVKVAKIDGEKIKEDTWYCLKNGVFVEANADEY